MRKVFVPGFTQRAAVWDGVRHRVTDSEAVDLPFGLDFDDTALELRARCGQAEYVGYSLGGRLCLRLALEVPTFASRLVLVSASPGIVGLDDRAHRRTVDDEWAQLIEREGVDAFYERWLAQPLFASLGRDSHALERRERREDVLVHGLRVLGQGAMEPLWDRLGELAVPVTLIVGALDEKYLEIATRMRAQIRDASLHVVEGAGHAVHLEQPEAVAGLLTTPPAPR